MVDLSDWLKKSEQAVQRPSGGQETKVMLWEVLLCRDVAAHMQQEQLPELLLSFFRAEILYRKLRKDPRLRWPYL